MRDNFKEQDDLYISHLNNISLNQFISFRSELCHNNHLNDCKECPLLIEVAVDILQSGVCEVSKLYRKHFSSTCHSSNTVRRFMQLPVVIFSVGQRSGMQKLFFVEKQENIDYKKVVGLIEKFTLQPNLETGGGIKKDTLLPLCKLASTESDRKLIKFAVCEASNYSNKKAGNNLGMQGITKLKEVRNASEEAQSIRQDVADLAMVREKPVLRSLGLYIPCDSDASDSDAESEAEITG